MNEQPSSPWVNRPKQARSRRTLQRLLDATERMIEEGTFEQATIPGIVARAQSSVGSFYALFKNKEALLECLLDRYQERLVGVARDFAEDDSLADADLFARATAWITKLVSFFRAERGLLRTRVLHNAQRPHLVPERRKREVHTIQGYIREFFRPSLAQIAHPQPEKALDVALMVLDYTICYRMLLEDPTARFFGDLDDTELIGELRRMFLSYLGAFESEQEAPS